MTALSDCLSACRAEDRAALVGCLPAGFPSVDGCIEALAAMVEGGVDIVEVELPYSDPLMDGPTIQAASEIALRGGTTTDDVLTTVRAVADSGAVAILMTYWNPVVRRGVARFAGEMAAAGGSAIVTPDLVPDEAAEWLAASDESGLDRVFLVAPSSTEERLRYTTDHCRGFVYAASTMGVTGTRTSVGAAAEQLVARTRAVTDIPVCVGLGVSNREQAAQVASFADGVIVGSAFVRPLLDAPSLAAGVSAVRDLAAELAEGVRSRSVQPA